MYFIKPSASAARTHIHSHTIMIPAEMVFSDGLYFSSALSMRYHEKHSKNHIGIYSEGFYLFGLIVQIPCFC